MYLKLKETNLSIEVVFHFEKFIDIYVFPFCFVFFFLSKFLFSILWE